MRTFIKWLDTDWDREKLLEFMFGPPTLTNVLAGVLIGSLIVIVYHATGH